MINIQNSVQTTIFISLSIQIILLIITFNGFFIKLDAKDLVLKQIFVLEYIVQVIEVLMYMWLINSIATNSVLVQRRYIDWVITTPIMLISTILFMQYKLVRHFSIKTFFYEESRVILQILGFNWLMLLLGFLGESKRLNKILSVSIGFICFFGVFGLIKSNFVKDNIINERLFWFITIIWGLYGVAAIANDRIKNIAYNFLDIFSKNFYELFIYIMVVYRQIS